MRIHFASQLEQDSRFRLRALGVLHVGVFLPEGGKRPQVRSGRKL